MKICKFCKHEFLPLHEESEFCNADCGGKWEKRPKERIKRLIKCIICNKEVIVSASNQIYCSKECYDIGEKKLNKLSSRKSHLKLKYNLTLENYYKMYENQNKKCLICNKKLSKLNIDHDHYTGKVRGLLCHGCNLLLGLVHDNSKILLKAIKYLNEKS
jgi:hypothetical protein